MLFTKSLLFACSMLAFSSLPAIAQSIENTDIFKAATIYNVNRKQAYEIPVLMSFANKYRQKNPDATQAEISSAVNKIWETYRQEYTNAVGKYDLATQTPALVTYSLLNIIKSSEHTEVSGAVLEEFTNWWYRFGNSIVAPDKQLSAQSHLLFNFRISSGFQDIILSEAIKHAEASESFRRSFDSLFAREIGARIGDSEDTIRSSNPAFDEALKLDGVLDKLDQMDFKNDAERNRALSAILSSVAEKTDEIINRFGRGEKKVDDLSSLFASYILNEQVKAQQIEQKRRAAEAARIELEGIRAVGFIISTAIGFGDPDAARKFSAVFNGAVDITQAINKLDQNLASDAAASAAGAIFSANMIAIGLSVASAFADSGPSADQLILEAIQKLAEQIEEFRVQVHERFDAVDDKLNFIIFEMSDNFASIKADLATINDISTFTLQEVRQLSEAVQFGTERQAQLFRERVFVDQANKIAKCYYYKDDVPDIPVSPEEFDDCLDYFKSNTLTVSKLSGFDETSHILYDPFSEDWAKSPRSGPLERIVSDLDALFSGRIPSSTYESVSQPAFYSISANYFATVRAWPEYHGLLSKTAFREFRSTIDYFNALDRQILNGNEHWNLTIILDSYLRIIRLVDAELYEIALDVTEARLRGYNDHRYQLFLEPSDPTQSNLESLRDRFELMDSCGPSGETQVIGTMRNSWPPYAETKGHLLTLRLGAIKTPQELFDTIVRLDESGNAISNVTREEEPICYNFEPNWIRERYQDNDADYPDWFIAFYAPRMDIQMSVRGTSYFAAETVRTRKFAWLHDGSLALRPGSYINAKRDIEQRIGEILKYMAGKIDEAGDLSSQDYWKVRLPSGDLEGRLEIAREEYLSEVRRHLENRTELRERILLATYLKETISRFLKEEWAQGMLLEEPELSLIASGAVLPDYDTAIFALENAERAFSDASRFLQPISISDWRAPSWSVMSYPTRQSPEIESLIKKASATLQSIIDEEDDPLPVAARQHMIAEIEFLENKVGSN